MSRRRDVKALVQAMNSVGVTELQMVLASTLLAVNGLAAALAFVDRCAAHNAAGGSPEPAAWLPLTTPTNPTDPPPSGT